MKKKFLKASSAFLAGLMLFSTLPLNSFAAETIYSDSYDFSHNHSEQTRYKDESGNWQDGLACYSPEYHVHTSAEGANKVTVNGIEGYDKSGNCYTKDESHKHQNSYEVVDYQDVVRRICDSKGICCDEEVYGHQHEYLNCFNTKPLYTKIDFLSYLLRDMDVEISPDPTGGSGTYASAGDFPGYVTELKEIPHVHKDTCEKHIHTSNCFTVLHVHTDDCKNTEGEYICGYDEDEVVDGTVVNVNDAGETTGISNLPNDYIGDTKISDATCGYENNEYICGIEFDKQETTAYFYDVLGTELTKQIDDITTIWGNDEAHESHNDHNILDNYFSNMSKEEMSDWLKDIFTTEKKTIEKDGKTYIIRTGQNIKVKTGNVYGTIDPSYVFFEGEDNYDAPGYYLSHNAMLGIKINFLYIPENLNDMPYDDLGSLKTLLNAIGTNDPEYPNYSASLNPYPDSPLTHTFDIDRLSNKLYCRSCCEEFTGTVMFIEIFDGSFSTAGSGRTRHMIPVIYHNRNIINELCQEFGEDIRPNITYNVKDILTDHSSSHLDWYIPTGHEKKFLANYESTALKDKLWQMAVNDAKIYFKTATNYTEDASGNGGKINTGWTTGYDNYNISYEIDYNMGKYGRRGSDLGPEAYGCTNFDPNNCTEDQIHKLKMVWLKGSEKSLENYRNTATESYYANNVDLFHKGLEEGWATREYLEPLSYVWYYDEYNNATPVSSYNKGDSTFTPIFNAHFYDGTYQISNYGGLWFDYLDGYMVAIPILTSVKGVYADSIEGKCYTYSRIAPMPYPQNNLSATMPEDSGVPWMTWIFENYQLYGGKIEGKNYANMFYNDCTHIPNVLLGYEFNCQLSDDPVFTLTCGKVENETIETEAYKEHFHDTNGGRFYRYAYVAGYKSYNNFCTEPSDCFTEKVTARGHDHTHEEGVNTRTVYLKHLHQNSDTYMVCDESTPGAFQTQISEQYVYPCYTSSCFLFQDENCRELYTNPSYSSPNPSWYMMNCIDLPEGETMDIYKCTCTETSDYRDIYDLTCPYEEEEKILTATFAVDDTNQLEVSPTNLGENSKYTVEWTLPDNSTTTGSTIQGTKSGVYKAKVDVYSNIDYTDNTGTHTRKLFEGTHTFEYDLQINNKFQVHYNLELDTDPDNLLDVTADEAFELPAADVNQVPKVDGYTFDGWFTEEGDKVFNVDGSSIEDVYTYGGDVYAYVDYHKNTYKIHYNNTDVSDEVLDKLMQVVYGDAYDQIAPSPYKTGYIFTGHTLDTDEAPEVWTFAGLPKSEIWDLFAGKDNADINAYKNYDPKTFIVNFADDFNGDYVPDGDRYTEEITYNSLWSTPSEMNSITFTGYEPSGWALSDGTSINPDDIWTIDDGKDWNTETPDEFLVLRKWQPKTYVINYNNTTIEDTDLDKQETVAYGDAYNDIAYSPYKEGYMFEGHILKGTD